MRPEWNDTQTPPSTLPRGHLKTPLLCADSQLLFWQWGNPFWKWFSARDKEQNLKFSLIARTYFSQTAPVSNDVLPQQNAVRVLCLGSELITPHKYPTYRNWGAIRKYLKGGMTRWLEGPKHQAGPQQDWHDGQFYSLNKPRCEAFLPLSAFKCTSYEEVFPYWSLPSTETHVVLF